jgi:hypothetical protein
MSKRIPCFALIGNRHKNPWLNRQCEERSNKKPRLNKAGFF